MKLAVVTVTRLVVVIGKQVGGDERHAGLTEYLHLDQPRGAPVSIVEWVDPRKVQVADHGLDERTSDDSVIVGWKVDLQRLGQPAAQLSDKIRHAIPVGRSVRAHGYVMAPVFAGDMLKFVFGTLGELPIHVRNSGWGKRNFSAAVQGGVDLLDRGEEVRHLDELVGA